MTERDRVRQELNDQFSDVGWPEVRMDVPPDYWEKAKWEALSKMDSVNGQNNRRGLIIPLVSLAAAIVFLLFVWNPFQPTEQNPLADISGEELEQYLLETSNDFNDTDWAYLLAGQTQSDLQAEYIDLSEKDWNTIIEDWSYELNDNTIYELQNQIQ